MTKEIYYVREGKKISDTTEYYKHLDDAVTKVMDSRIKTKVDCDDHVAMIDYDYINEYGEPILHATVEIIWK